MKIFDDNKVLAEVQVDINGDVALNIIMVYN